MISSGRVTGAILAGGQSSRMGRNKAFLELGGMTIIERIASTMKEVLEEVAIVGGDPDSTSYLKLPFVPDIRLHSGPLGGIHAALSAAGADRVFIISCDVPLIRPPLIHYVLESESSSPVTVVSDAGQVQPLCGVYRRSVIGIIEEQIGSGDLRMKSLLDRACAAVLPLSPSLAWYSPFLLKNINDPSDYEALLKSFPEGHSR